MICKQFGTCSPTLLFFTDVSNCPHFPSHCTHTAHPSANSLTSSFRETEIILLHTHRSQWQAFPSCSLDPRPQAPTYYLNLSLSATQFCEHFSMNKFFSSEKILPFPQFPSDNLAVMGTGWLFLAYNSQWARSWPHCSCWCGAEFTAATLGGSLPGPPFQSPLSTSSSVIPSVLLSSWLCC